jgi:exodeoxyribonuclease VII small subunit
MRPLLSFPAVIAVMNEKRPRIDLEKTLAELEEIVEQLESGDLPLEKSLKAFERGVRLSRECQAALKDAEQRVQILMDSDLKDLDPETLAEIDDENEEEEDPV